MILVFWMLSFKPAFFTFLFHPDGVHGKESACQCRRHRDSGLIPGSGRSPGGEDGIPLQYSCQENSMDRGAWRATVHGVAKSRTQLNDFHLFYRCSNFVSSEDGLAFEFGLWHSLKTPILLKIKNLSLIYLVTGSCLAQISAGKISLLCPQGRIVTVSSTENRNSRALSECVENQY